MIQVHDYAPVARIGDQRIWLTATEHRILRYLCDNRGHVVTRTEFMRDVWDHSEPVNSRALDTHLCRLRRKIGTDAIVTTHTSGYLLLDTVTHE